jgi:hypothetical protein
MQCMTCLSTVSNLLLHYVKWQIWLFKYWEWNNLYWKAKIYSQISGTSLHFSCEFLFAPLRCPQISVMKAISRNQLESWKSLYLEFIQWWSRAFQTLMSLRAFYFRVVKSIQLHSHNKHLSTNNASNLQTRRIVQGEKRLLDLSKITYSFIALISFCLLQHWNVTESE